MKRIRDHLAAHPRRLFAMDASGALLTAFFTGIVWTSFQQYIGMPPAILKLLAVIAVMISSYAAACFLFVKKGWPSFLKAILIGNGLYCILTLCLLGINYAALTLIGIIYFLGEIGIISLLICLEFKVLAAIVKAQRG